MTDRLRSQHREYGPHLGLGNRRDDSTYQPKYTHEEIDRLLDEFPTSTDSDSGAEVVVFGSLSSTVGTSESGPFVPRRDHTSLSVLVVRKTGTTAMTIEFYKNGVSVGSVTTGATDLVATAEFDVPFAGDTDVLTIAATTVGTGTTWATAEVTLL